MKESQIDIKSIKAIVTDIDGSITDNNRRISTKAVEAIRAVEERGIPVMLASGNVLPLAFGLASFIGISGPVIAENGGAVFYKYQVKYLADRKRCDEAFKELKKHLPVKKLFTDRWRRAEVAIETNVSLEEVRKFVGDYNLKVETTGFAIHIFDQNMSKLNGLKVACEMMGIDIKDVVAFGDSENDIEMIEHCGVGMAPSNAKPELKACADFVATSPNGEGFIEGVRWLGILG
jgi:phosphoglycolate phosphatase (TIGR01487 family)